MFPGTTSDTFNCTFTDCSCSPSEEEPRAVAAGSACSNNVPIVWVDEPCQDDSEIRYKHKDFVYSKIRVSKLSLWKRTKRFVHPMKSGKRMSSRGSRYGFLAPRRDRRKAISHLR